METGTNTASEPAEQPPGTTPFSGQGHLDYARLEGDARRPGAHAEKAAAQNLDLWISRITTKERLALAVSIRWLLTLLVHGGCPPASITEKRPNHGQVSVHGELKFIEGQQQYVQPCVRWLLTSQSHHLEEETRTMVDVTFSHRAEPHAPLTTMDHHSQWHYVAYRLIAHMRTYSPDKMDGLHWRWHQRAALRIRTAMQRHNFWAIPGFPGYQGHASGHR